jgi:cyclophilin family peptidyl-prolyl cis-trans isomerase
VGTDKRARQKAGRQARLEALQAQQQQAKRKRSAITIGAVLAVFLVAGLLISVLVGGGDDDGGTADGGADTTALDPTATTAGTPEAFAYGTGECPPTDGSAEVRKTFDDAPQLCIDPTKTYLATFKTSEGDVKVQLDTERTPGTTNNFVTLARWGYYDDTVIFRTDPSIDIIQGGGTTNTDDPGYTIPDEGGSFTYQPGDLTMARTGAPDSAGGQWFFGVGPNVANLDSQGTYVTFGRVTEGLDVLESILALHEADTTGAMLGGAPSRTVAVETVEISEL